MGDSALVAAFDVSHHALYFDFWFRSAVYGLDPEDQATVILL